MPLAWTNRFVFAKNAVFFVCSSSFPQICLCKKRVRRLLYSLYTLSATPLQEKAGWLGIVLPCLAQGLEFPELGSCYNRVSPAATHI